MLQDFVNLLEPFAIETDNLQTDALSLLSVITSILNLECHLEQFGEAKDVAVKMHANLHRWLGVLLQPNDPNFNPLPSTACLPHVCCLMLRIHKSEAVQRHTFFQRPKSLFKVIYIQQLHLLFRLRLFQQRVQLRVHLTKWKFSAIKQQVDERRLISGNEAQTELNKYFIEIRNSTMCRNSLNFWKIRRAVYPYLAPIAGDLTCNTSIDFFHSVVCSQMDEEIGCLDYKLIIL